MNSSLNKTFETDRARFGQIDRLLHLLAGSVILLFAVSHFAFLITPEISSNLYLQNIVFPIFNDKTVFFIAGLFEISVGLLCLKYHGTAKANLVIMTYVGIILWYRWAFFYSGGVHCQCLGYLGRLLHVGKTMENTLPILALVLLLSTTTPWFYRKGSRYVRKIAQGVLMLLLFAPQLGHSAGAIEVIGEYDATNYNPGSKAHEVYRGTQVNATFKVELSQHCWLISVSNIVNGDSAQIWFDGTSTFTLDKRQLDVSSGKQFIASISPTQYYVPGGRDAVDISFPWLVYGLSPTIISSNASGIPLPWLSPRSHADAFGYKWIFSPSSDGRFIAECKVVRDHALDLTNIEENMLRPDVIYPGNVMERNSYISDIYTGKYIPGGFVAAEYRCEKWQQTNGWSLPMAATVAYYWPDAAHLTNTWLEGHLKVNRIAVSDREIVLPEPFATTQVADFRYREFNGTRLYRGAIYTLKAGESWKSANDPLLLAEAKYHLTHGPRYDALSPAAGKKIIIWVVFGILLAIPCAIILYSKHKQNRINGKL